MSVLSVIEVDTIVYCVYEVHHMKYEDYKMTYNLLLQEIQ